MYYISKNEKLLELSKKVLEEVGYDPENITTDFIDRIEHTELCVCEGSDGLDYLWYLDGDGCSVCMRIATEKFIDEEEIEAIFGPFE